MSQIESTYKSLETEETLDIYFYRPVGFVIARISQLLKLTPNMVTSLGAMFGVVAGHLFYYKEIEFTLTGILLLMLSEALDSADGQLARMTNKYSRLGRILDGFATNLIFFSVYVHLCLRLMNEGWSLWIFAIAIVSGISHSVQSAMADYYRNGYMRFVISNKKGELDSSEDIRKKYSNLRWQKNPLSKFFLKIYLNYTREQEVFSPNFRLLKTKVENIYPEGLPEEMKEQYKFYSKPLIKFYNILTTNTRMIFLFFSVLIDVPMLYFLFELIFLNALLLHVIICQEMACKILLSRINIELERQKC